MCKKDPTERHMLRSNVDNGTLRIHPHGPFNWIYVLPRPKTKNFLASYLECCTGCAWRNRHLGSRQGYGTTAALP
jgi:hypothetical protein